MASGIPEPKQWTADMRCGNMELLSPAGDMAAFRAAIACGADAVYLGYTSFGARSYAGNFDKAALCEAVAYAHERGRKVYVTVNTLIKEREMKELRDTLDTVCYSGADAIIIQDLGIIRIAAQHYPGLKLHASTQMAVHNAQGASLLFKMGLPRVVAARECSIQEIRRMRETGAEIEVFGHGSLCVSVSGQCLFSSMIGGRSGNRGKCAQPCRMQYRLENGTDGYLLSTRDLMLLGHLREMRDAGVSSVKIEGRMKRPEYVGVVTKAYRQALDALDDTGKAIDEQSLADELLQIYNRGGFTEGYLLGSNHAALMSWQKQNHAGVEIGRIIKTDGKSVLLLAEKDIRHGDTLQFRGKTEQDIVYDGSDVAAGNKVWIPLRSTAGIAAGEKGYRIVSTLQLSEINGVIQANGDRIPVYGKLSIAGGKPSVLELWDDDRNHVLVTGECATEAVSRPLNKAAVETQMAKMGDSAYKLSSLEIELQDGVFLPLGALNGLRRQAVSELREKRIHRPSQLMPLKIPEAQDEDTAALKKELVISSPDLSDSILIDEGADRFIWKPDTLIPDELEALLAGDSSGLPVGLELPAVTYTQELEQIVAFVGRHTDRIRFIVANSVGQLAVDWPCSVWSGQGMNLFNKECAAMLSALKVSAMTVSCELSVHEVDELVSADKAYVMEVYGRTQLMLLSHCPVRTERGDQRTDNQCNRCRAEHRECTACYTDTKGYRFPAYNIRTPHGCLLRIYNSLPLDAARYEKQLNGLQCAFRLSFTDEPFSKKSELVRSYRNLLDCGKALHSPGADSTGGRLLKGVE